MNEHKDQEPSCSNSNSIATKPPRSPKKGLAFSFAKLDLLLFAYCFLTMPNFEGDYSREKTDDGESSEIVNRENPMLCTLRV